MRKRLAPLTPPLPDNSPFHGPCMRCGEHREVMVVTHLENPMIVAMFCEPCCTIMLKESARGRNAKIDYRLLPKCASCWAQVPGIAKAGTYEEDDAGCEPWREHEVSTVVLCHQCITTLCRRCQQDKQETAVASCPHCGTSGALYQDAEGRWGCLACDRWVEPANGGGKPYAPLL